MESHAHLIKDTIETMESRRRSLGKMFNRPRPLTPGNRKLSWQRPTYYTPPRNEPQLSCLPPGLFGKFVRDDYLASSSSQPTTISLEYDGDPDKFGFVKLVDGRVYNVMQKEIMDRHPFDDE